LPGLWQLVDPPALEHGCSLRAADALGAAAIAIAAAAAANRNVAWCILTRTVTFPSLYSDITSIGRCTDGIKVFRRVGEMSSTLASVGIAWPAGIGGTCYLQGRLGDRQRDAVKDVVLADHELVDARPVAQHMREFLDDDGAAADDVDAALVHRP
jgi:hypothetical protein